MGWRERGAGPLGGWTHPFLRKGVPRTLPAGVTSYPQVGGNPPRYSADSETRACRCLVQDLYYGFLRRFRRRGLKTSPVNTMSLESDGSVGS